MTVVWILLVGAFVGAVLWFGTGLRRQRPSDRAWGYGSEADKLESDWDEKLESDRAERRR